MTIKEIEEVLVNPSCYTLYHEEVAILRIWNHYDFIEYPRSELKAVMEEFKRRLLILETGIEKPNACDKFLFQVLRSMSGDVN